MNKAIFLDRDGVINDNSDLYYVTRLEQFKILPNVKESMEKFKSLGFLVIVVTNQQAVGKGLMSESELMRIHDFMVKQLPEIDDVFYCPHLEGTCDCRKPSTKLFEKAAKKYNINFSKSWVIGDSERDIIPGKKLGCKTIRILKDGKTEADFVAKSLLECLTIISKNSFGD
ncbi:MAG: D-glycero-D-manno-heptose 1,7-bisphosphate phosphatase [Candidatus Woesearchaeota archaeon]|nr:D-glycero-D-manno-heptose 1,7-bisphosphate phosphatase [Candidatus Woesearchaeota archaeon]